MEDTKKYLAYVRPVGKNSQGLNEYEFFFTETLDRVWGQDWNELCPSACGDIPPDPSTYNEIDRLATDIKFNCAQENSCFSMQDMIDGILVVCHESLDGMEEYPTPFRLVFKFGETKENVVDLLSQREQFFSSQLFTDGNDTEKDKEEDNEDDEKNFDDDEIF